MTKFLLFQSLFSWNLPSDFALHHAGQVSISPVSILVFLELALGPFVIVSICRQTACFNPCFLGTCPRTPDTRAFGQGVGKAVSILVFLELALGRH